VLIRNLTLGLCVSFCTTACVSTMGTIRLTQVDEQPCFSVEDTPANRRNPPLLWAISVEDMEQKPPKKTWSFTMPIASQPILRPNSCVQYGQIPPGGEQHTPPTKLELGHVYSAVINASPESPSNRIYLYVVEFCLIRDASGTTKIHEIQWDEKQARWRYDACRL
jgi:hypothetical protein